MASNSTIRCPRRKYAVAGSDPAANAASSVQVSLIGLGCSSFSAFFQSSTSSSDSKADSGDISATATSFDSKACNPSDPTAAADDEVLLTRDNITKSHPQVQAWIAAIRRAVLVHGINLLDTAPWYGHGISEIVVGYALEDILRGDSGDSTEGTVSRDELIINTKVGRYEADPAHQFDFSYDRVLSSVQTSIQRMKCNYVDVIQLHDPEFSPSIGLLLEETIPALLLAKERGWARSVGITGYPLEVQREILLRSATDGGQRFVFDQALTYCHCNLHDMSLFIAPPPLGENVPSTVSLNSDLDKTVVASNAAALSDTEENNHHQQEPATSFADFCQSNGVGLLAAAPLSMGLLTQAGPPDWHPANPKLKQACRDAAYICKEEYGADIASLAILFALAQVDIPCTVLGMKSVEEVDRAMELARRFDVGRIGEGSTTEKVLVSVLDVEEKEALKTILDDEYGPFAGVWTEGTFQWDGVEIADEHWSKVEGGKEEADKRMRIRTSANPESSER